MSDIESNDKIYLEDIHPHIEMMKRVCKQKGIKMFVSCEPAKGVLRNSMVNLDDDNFDKFNLLKAVVTTNTLDDFLLSLIEDAKHYGHNSRILTAMGIPKKHEVKTATLKLKSD